MLMLRHLSEDAYTKALRALVQAHVPIPQSLEDEVYRQRIIRRGGGRTKYGPEAIAYYIERMTTLRTEYPGISFAQMEGQLEGPSKASLHRWWSQKKD